jgi:putative flavoprotein involved in K+ transport
VREEHDTVIVGGGQAGLAMSHHLRERQREHVILERHRVAERWRSERWDSLHFLLPNQWLSLPGKSYHGSEPGGFTHHDVVLRFVLDYAAEIDAPVRSGVNVTSLKPGDNAAYALDTSDGEIAARHVVIATGPFQRPLIADCAKALPKSVHQIDAIHYRNPQELPPGAVLVVGSGNSGCQIVDELLDHGRRVFFALGRHSRPPRRYRGKDVIWWFEELGRFDIPVDTFPNRKYPPTSLLTGMKGGYDLDPRRSSAAGAILLGRLTGAMDGKLAFADDAESLLAAADQSHANFIAAADKLAQTRSDLGPADPADPPAAPPIKDIRSLDLARENIGTIIWSAGYGYDFAWVHLPILDAKGAPIQARGVTACPGVYFLGLHWMHTFRSAIMPFVGRDAEYLAEHMDGLDRT